MTDGRDRALGALERGAQQVRRGTRLQPCVDLQRRSRRGCDLLGRLAGAEQRARDDEHGWLGQRGKAGRERTGLLATRRRQLAQVVRIARRGLGVSAEVDTHEASVRAATRPTRASARKP